MTEFIELPTGCGRNVGHVLRCFHCLTTHAPITAIPRYVLCDISVAFTRWKKSLLVFLHVNLCLAMLSLGVHYEPLNSN